MPETPTVRLSPAPPPPPAPPISSAPYPPLPMYPRSPAAYERRPSRRRTGLVVTLFVIIGVLFAGGIGVLVVLDRVPLPPLTAPAASASGGPPTLAPTPVGTPFAGDLRTLLLSQPVQASPYPSPLSSDGSLNADDVANLYPDPDQVRSVLTDNGFVSAAVTQWVQADGTTVEIKLYAFADQAGAQAWASRESQSYVDDPTISNMSPVAGIDDSTLAIDPTPDARGDIQSVAIATRGNIVMKVFVYQPHAAVQAVTVAIANQQYNLLP
jgi:hypothetical protein